MINVTIRVNGGKLLELYVVYQDKEDPAGFQKHNVYSDGSWDEPITVVWHDRSEGRTGLVREVMAKIDEDELVSEVKAGTGF